MKWIALSTILLVSGCLTVVDSGYWPDPVYNPSVVCAKVPTPQYTYLPIGGKYEPVFIGFETEVTCTQ